MPTGHDLLNERIRTKLIQWCIDNNKMLYDVPRVDENGKKHSLYDLMFSLKRNLKYITKENIELLNKYGMVWGESNSKTHQIHIIKRIKSELIVWCDKHNKMIYDVPRIDENGEINPLYVFCINLRKKLDKLPEEIVALLKEYGMTTESSLLKKTHTRVIIRRIKNELIPWCIENNKQICDMPRLDEKGKKPLLYDFVYWLRKNAEYLPEEIISLLNQYGMQWTATRKKTLDLRAKKYLIAWHEKTGIPLKDMPTRDENGYPYTEYMFRNYIKQHKDELQPETIAELDRCGMDWTIQKRKTNKNNNIGTDPVDAGDGTTV